MLAQHGHRVWAMDFVGQGRSWPRQPHGVAYSVDLWTEQVHQPRRDVSNQFSDSLHRTPERLWVRICAGGRSRSTRRHVTDPACSVQVKSFVDENIGEAVFVVGNSLGGFVAAAFAALHPSLSRGVRLRLLWPVDPLDDWMIITMLCFVFFFVVSGVRPPAYCTIHLVDGNAAADQSGLFLADFLSF